jgi:hypothetical protein
MGEMGKHHGLPIEV